MPGSRRKSGETVRAFAPATIANVGPGYDFFGVALDGIGDTVTLTRTDKAGVTIASITGDGGKLPMETVGNSASVVALKMLDDAGADFGLELVLDKGLPLESGLGSSGASSAAAAAATNAMLGGRYRPEELVEFARYGEDVAAGAPHADNVAPAVLGGFVLVRHAPQQEVIHLDVPKGWYVAVCHPHLALSTKEARQAVPSEVTLRKLGINASNAAAVVAAVAKHDIDLFGRAIMSDVVVEPVRGAMIKGYQEVKDAALVAGAVGVSISGAGPSMFAVAGTKVRAEKVAEAMAAAWKESGIEVDKYVCDFGAEGARIIK